MIRKIIKFLIVVFIIFVCFHAVARKKKKLSKATSMEERPIIVSVYRTKKINLEKFKEYLGKVEPINKANVSTRIAAIVEKVYVDEGSIVKKGDLLAELDKKDILSRLNSAKENLIAAKENLNYWEKEFDRDQFLFQKGAISEEERDRAKNNLAQAKARVKIVEELINFWQANLRYTKILSPYDGVISKRFVDPGDLAVIGRPLFTVEDRSKLKIVFDVPQIDAPFIKKGLPVIFKTEGILRKTKISNVFPSLEKGRVLHIECFVNKKLLVGSFIPVKVILIEKRCVAVPVSSVFSMGNQTPFVFIVENNTLKRIPIEKGIETDEFVEVKNLKEGILVVKEPYLSWTKLAPGEKVKIMQGGGK